MKMPRKINLNNQNTGSDDNNENGDNNDNNEHNENRKKRKITKKHGLRTKRKLIKSILSKWIKSEKIKIKSVLRGSG